MTREELNQLVCDAGYGEEDLLIADGFEDACLGIAVQFNRPMVLYDQEKCIEILMQRDGMSYEDALDYFGFNTQGAYVGEKTPAFLYRFDTEVLHAETHYSSGPAIVVRMRRSKKAVRKSRTAVRRRSSKSASGARGVRACASSKHSRKNSRKR